jgi:NADPH-dependent 2,4-dienoyl-CoA reductase/sulfur reductase-like enzyme
MNGATRVIVVGAGPGGMAAAAVAAESGCEVTLLDENPAPGGQLWRGASPDSPSGSPHGAKFAQWMKRLTASGAEVVPEAAVVDAPSEGVLRVERAGAGQDLFYDRLILATGARERFLPFPGWTLQGVMGAGGLQAMAKSGLPVSGKKIVIAGSGPLLLAVATYLRHAGASVLGVFEQAPWARLLGLGVALSGHPDKLLEALGFQWQTRAVPYKPGWWVASALGVPDQNRLESVVVTDGHEQRKIACDYLACGFHLVPNLELAQLLGCRIESGYVTVNDRQQTSVVGVFCVGEPTGVGGLDKALVEGEIAGLSAAGQVGKAAQFSPLQKKLRHFAKQLDETFVLRSELRTLAGPDTIVCRCEDVTYDALKLCESGRAAKLHTRCGMGPCQARVCGPATEFLFGWAPGSVRPPLYPASIATMAGNPESETSADPASLGEMP